MKESITLKEKDLQDAIIDYAKLKGWLVHTERAAWTGKGYRTPIQGHKGFPDIVLVRGKRIIFAELKSDKGQLSPEQHEWMAALQETGVERYIWKPEHWTDSEVIENTLL